MSVTATSPGAPWYAIATRARYERHVYQQLVQKRIDAFLPTVARWSRWTDRRKKVEWPLFDGYCFARIETPNTLPVLTCAGVLRIVSFDGRPAPIDEQEVHNLRVLATQEVDSDPCPFIRDGALVEVVAGPLRGVRGRLIKTDMHRASLLLAVELIGRAVRVDVDASDLTPL